MSQRKGTAFPKVHCVLVKDKTMLDKDPRKALCPDDGLPVILTLPLDAVASVERSSDPSTPGIDPLRQILRPMYLDVIESLKPSVVQRNFRIENADALRAQQQARNKCVCSRAPLWRDHVTA